MRNLDHMPSCSTVPAGVQLSAAAFLAFFPNTDGEAPNLGSSNSEKMQEPVTPTPFYWLMYLQRRPCPLSQEGLIQLAFPQHSSGTPQTGSYPDKKVYFFTSDRRHLWLSINIYLQFYIKAYTGLLAPIVLINKYQHPGLPHFTSEPLPIPLSLLSFNPLDILFPVSC